MNRIQRIMNDAVKVKQALVEDVLLVKSLSELVDEMVNCYKKDGKVLLCGNGGSAADAQHIAAELSGRFYTDRDPLYAEALHVNSSYLTAVANDYDFETVYARLVKAKGRKGDILIGISCSGSSENILRALKAGHDAGMITAGFTGEDGSKMEDSCKYLLKVSSNDTPRIQEAHILLGHILCELVESALFGK